MILAAFAAVVGCSSPMRPEQSSSATVTVESGTPLRRMESGVGACWHALMYPVQGQAGSSWGATPPADDEAAWQQIERAARWLGLDFLRVELSHRMFEPERQRFDWNNAEMLVLYRILDWADRNGADVFLQLQFNDVAWNTHPGIDPLHSAPLSVDDFAAGVAELADHLLRARRFRSIRWLAITNEPGNSWSWWQDGKGRPMPIGPALRAVRAQLDRRGLKLPLAGPDWTDGLAERRPPSSIDFDDVLGAYDLHTYHARLDGQWTWWRGYSMASAMARFATWADWSHSRGKPFFITELGSMMHGWKQTDPGPGSFPSALANAEMVVRGIGAGVDGFARWSFLNRGDLDGQWQMLDTWDAAGNRFLPRFTPHPNPTFAYGMLSRFIARGSTVLASSVDGGGHGRTQHVFAAALRSPGGRLTIAVVNDADHPWTGRIHLRSLSGPRHLVRYRFSSADRDRADFRLAATATFEFGPTASAIDDVLPPASVSVYTEFQLGPEEPGVVND